MRRAGHEGLNKAVAPKFYTPQTREAVLLVDNMLKDPEHWNEEIRRYVACRGEVSCTQRVL